MFKVGDKVTIIDRQWGHEFDIGEVVEITEVSDDCKDSYYAVNANCDGWYLSDDEIKLIDAESINGESNTHDHYNKSILGKDGTKTTVDVYRVLEAFNVTNPQLQHIVKKALCAGQRGHKDYLRDLQDIVDSAKNAIEMEKQKGGGNE